MADLRPELRFHPQAELRADFGAEGRPQRIVGYAATWDTISHDLGGFREVVRRGAFTATLREGADVRAKLEHTRTPIPLGRTKSKTLSLAEDDRGLHFEIILPDTAEARSVAEAVRRGDIDGASFAFVTRPNGYRWARDGTLRELLDLDLLDVSIVDSPAYPDTSVAVRSLAEYRQRTDVARRIAEVRVRAAELD